MNSSSVAGVLTRYWLTQSAAAGREIRTTLAAPAEAVCDLLAQYSLNEPLDGHFREIWHPANDRHARGELTACRLFLSADPRRSRPQRWDRWGDPQVLVIDQPSREAIFLLPSRLAPQRFHDSRELTPGSALLAEKQALGLEFMTAYEKTALEGLLFHKTMASGVRHLHVYSPVYDAFLAGRKNYRAYVPRADLEEYARRYETLREREPPGSARTTKMNALMEEIAQELRGSVGRGDLQKMYERNTEGHRFVALVCCIRMPREAPPEILIDALYNPRSPFEQWTALRAIERVVAGTAFFLVEPPIEALLRTLDDEHNIINTPTDKSRRELANAILTQFATAVGFDREEWTPELLRWWLRGAEPFPPDRHPCMALFGSDPGNATRSLCEFLGEHLARAGWRLQTGLGKNVGAPAAAVFAAQHGVSLTAFSTTPVPPNFPFPVQVEKPLQALRSKLITGIDCAIAICGAAGTAQECDMALAAGIPVLPIASTGGAAERYAPRRTTFLHWTHIPKAILDLIDVADTRENQARRIVRVANLIARLPSRRVVRSWTRVGELRGHSDVILHISWNPVGDQLATASVDQTVRIWDIRTQREVARLTGHTQGVNQATWSPDPGATRLATCSYDRTIRIWSTRDSRLIRTIEGHSADVRDVAWSPDGRLLASASADRFIAIWDANTGTLETNAQRTRAGEARRVFWIDGDTLVTCWESGGVCLYPATTPEKGATKVLRVPGEETINIAYSPQRQILAACSSSGTVRIWSWPDLAHLADVQIAKRPIRSVTFSPDGRFLAANTHVKNGNVYVYETHNWSEVSRFEESTSAFWPPNIAWAPWGHRLASLGNEDSIVRLWDFQENDTAPGSAGPDPRGSAPPPVSAA